MYESVQCEFLLLVLKRHTSICSCKNGSGTQLTKTKAESHRTHLENIQTPNLNACFPLIFKENHVHACWPLINNS